MGSPISWLDWFATQADHRRGRVAFGLTPLGRRALANADAATAPEPATTTDAPQVCVWCGLPILPGQPVTELGGRRLHDTPCLDEFDEVTSDRKARRAPARGVSGRAGRLS